MSENNLKMSSSPHIRSKATTSNIMMLVAIALLPASAFGVWNFGLPAFGMLVTTTVVAVLTEYIYEKLMHKKITINDWSAAVTGLLLGLNMPPTAPWSGFKFNCTQRDEIVGSSASGLSARSMTTA